MGTPEKVVNLFTFIAEEIREILSQLGFSSLNQIIGRSDLLKQVSRGSADLDDLDLSPLLIQADPGENKRYCERNFINEVPSTLDEKIYKDIKDLINTNKKIEVNYEIKNTHRAVGTRLSHYIFKHKDKHTNIKVNLVGSAGQSLGAFGIKGLKVCLTGDANDYVGKGLSGSTIVVKPPKRSNLISNENAIIGNTVLYGATSGKLFASGQAGERFAVRNSGAEAVVEGCASNGCEYMTGGMAFVYDANYDFENYINSESVIWQKPETQYWKDHLKNLIKEHFSETESVISKKIVENFDQEIKNFVQVCPKEMLNKLENPISFKKKFSQAI